jgi:carbonic anhydrase
MKRSRDSSLLAGLVGLASRAGAAALALGAAACTAPAPPPPESAKPASAHELKTGAGAPSAEAPHWTYEGEAGPASWGRLSPDFAACSAGNRQSPIDIGKTAPASLPELRAAFRPVELRIAHHEHVADAINNGHTIQVNYTEGDSLTVGDASYELVQYHFHSPSEHTIGGRHWPMEMHLVHQSGSGGLAVVAVLIEEGAHNAAFDPVWSHLPRQKGVESHLEHVKVNVDDLLPGTRTTYRYDGSLTTPPCSEGVKWLVMTAPVALSPEQISAFTALIKGNNRPVQALNGRAVATDRVVDVPSTDEVHGTKVR